MPIYKFLNTDTGEEFEDFLSISRKEELLRMNPHIQQVLTPFAIASSVGSLDSKTDDTWKEVLAKVAEAHPESNVADRYGSRGIKEVKTKEVIKKHREKWKNS